MTEQIRSLAVNQMPLPSDASVELACLSAMMQAPYAAEHAVKELRDEDFYNDRNRQIFKVFSRLTINNKFYDSLTAKKELSKSGIEIDTIEYTELINAAPNSSMVHEYATLLKSTAFKRKCALVSYSLGEAARKPDATPEELLQVVQNLSTELGERFHTTNTQQIGEILDGFYTEYRRVLNGERIRHSFVPTPYQFLNCVLGGGLTCGEQIYIAARPSVGKTTFALNLMRLLSIQLHIPCLFFSLEMTKAEVSDHILAAHTHINGQFIKKRGQGYNITPEMKQTIEDAQEVMDNAPLYIDDTGGLSFIELRSKVIDYVRKSQVKVVFIDYLQLMKPPKRENRNLEIGQLARDLKTLAKEVGIPIVILSQLSRPPKGEKPRKPFLTDLRDSGEIEQHADVVLMLHRDDYQNDDVITGHDDVPPVDFDVICRKNRNGALGTVKMVLHKSEYRIEERDIINDQSM